MIAQLGSSHTASGAITASSTSADLYICEPGSTPGPDCGPDDSGANEVVFETIENLRPGQPVHWDVRLRNVGSVDWIVTNVRLDIIEVSDPGSDC